MKTSEKRGDVAYLLDGPLVALDEAGLLKADSDSVDGILFAWPTDQDALDAMDADAADMALLASFSELIASYPEHRLVTVEWMPRDEKWPRTTALLLSVRFGVAMTPVQCMDVNQILRRHRRASKPEVSDRKPRGD